MLTSPVVVNAEPAPGSWQQFSERYEASDPMQMSSQVAHF